MSNKIIQLNEDAIKGELKEVVRNSMEETLNNLLDQEEKELTEAAKYERNQRGLTLLVPNHFNEKLSFLYIFR